MMRKLGDVMRDVLHDRDGALAHERDRHQLGADAVAHYAAGGVGSGEAHGGTSLKRALGAREATPSARVPFRCPRYGNRGRGTEGPSRHSPRESPPSRSDLT